MPDCDTSWSGQDEFVLYDDCHVWVPLYRIFYAIICIVAIADFILGYLRVSQGKGIFAICLTAYSFWLAIACGIRLTTGWVIGDRNVALNMTCALTLVFFWCGLSLYVLKYLNFIFQTERLRGRTEVILGRARQILYFFMFLTFVLQILNLVVPTLSEVDFLPTLWITIYFQASFLSVLFLYYGFKARTLINSIVVALTHAAESYKMLLQRLDFVLIPWTLGYIACTIIIALLLFADVFHRNQYILMPFTWLIEALIACSVLIATRGSALPGAVELVDNKNGSTPVLIPETPGLTDREMSDHLSESQSQNRSEISGTSATATPNLPNRHVKFSPLFGSARSTPQQNLRHLSESPNRPLASQPFSEAEEAKFRFSPFYKGMTRLEEGEWVASDESFSLTIDTTDRNPKPITCIEVIEDGDQDYT